MKRNYHKEAIKILNELDQNTLVRLMFDIAANNPSVLVKNHEVRFPKPVVKVYDESDNWKIVARELLEDGTKGYIAAVKHCRNITGWTLKRTVDEVKALREEMSS
jgi:hypothetical protein